MMRKGRLLMCHLAGSDTATWRFYGTSYTATVTSSSGQSLSAKVAAAELLPIDQHGYALPRLELVCRATQILLHQPRAATASLAPDRFADLTEFLASFSVTLTTAEACEILKSLKHPSLALKFFRFCPSVSPDFRHDSFTYTRLLLILSKSTSPERFGLVRSVLDEMDRSKVPGTISTVNILIGLFGHSPDLDLCLGLVQKWNLEMNSYTYKCLVQAYLRSHNSTKAFEAYREMRRKGYTLDIFAYNMLLDALAKDDKPERARMIFEDMKKKSIEPDEFTYTIMIRMAGRSANGDECLALFDEMISKGLRPNLIAYNTMIQALSRSGMVEKAVFLFSKMVEKSITPNEFTYRVMLYSLVTEGKLIILDEVVDISERYISKSIYAYLVRTLSQLGHGGEAHRLFRRMWAHHDTCDREACISMLDSLCAAEKTVEAIDLLDKMHEKGVTPDSVMFNTVFSTLSKLKHTANLHELHYKMKKQQVPRDIFTFNILIAAYGRAGKISEAVAVFEELEESNVPPDIISYNTLINILGKNGDMDQAHVRFREMRERGLSPDVVTYSTLIECFGKSDRIDMALKFFDEMTRDGCHPNIVTYNILLDCLVASGRTGEAVDLYKRLKEQGLAPDSITHAVLEKMQSGDPRKPRVRKQSPITGWVVSPLE